MTVLEDIKVPLRIRLAALWTSLMSCYIYGDFFGLFERDRLNDMIAGNFGPLGHTTPGILVGVSLMMAIPALMIFGSVALPAAPCRWSSIAFGLLYTVIMLLTLPGAPPFYVALGIIEVLLTATVVVLAWRWPKVA
jgi:hypothetical protein